MTNADKIRKKITDDEGLLDEIGTRCDRCIYGKGECIAVGGADCTVGCLEWLREEADEDA